MNQQLIDFINTYPYLLDKTKTRKYFDNYPYLYVDYVNTIKFDNELSFIDNFAKCFPYGIPSDVEILNKICEQFSKLYYLFIQNNDVFTSIESIYNFSYNCLMLSNNIHNHTNTVFISLDNFVKLNLNIPVIFVKQVYDTIYSNNYF